MEEGPCFKRVQNLITNISYMTSYLQELYYFHMHDGSKEGRVVHMHPQQEKQGGESYRGHSSLLYAGIILPNNLEVRGFLWSLK